MSVNQRGIISSLACYILILFCLVTTSSCFNQRSKFRRQIPTAELSTGLMNTGMSFNNFYEGQNPVDSYYGYQPTEQTRYSGGDGGYGSRGSNYAPGNGIGTGYGYNRQNDAPSAWGGFGYGKTQRQRPQYGTKY